MIQNSRLQYQLSQAKDKGWWCGFIQLELKVMYTNTRQGHVQHTQTWGHGIIVKSNIWHALSTIFFFIYHQCVTIHNQNA